MISKDKKALVLGLNQEGIAAFLALKKMGLQVRGLDLSLNPRNRQKALQSLHSYESLLAFEAIPVQTFSLIVLSGAKALYQKILDQMPPDALLTNPLEMASSSFKGSLVAVTGTNGKSTVSKLLEQMLLSSSKKVFLGGGSFEPYPALLNTKNAEIAVLETSSATLENVKTFRPKIAILSNLVPSHFDRYETSRQYFEAKSKVFLNQQDSDFLIYDAENPYVESLLKKSSAKLIPCYLSNPKRYSKSIQNFSYYEKGYLNFCLEGFEVEQFSAKVMHAAGYHMIMNALLALSAAKILGADSQSIQKNLDHFEPLPHRMKKCWEKNGFTFYDDARSSNPAATAWGLSSFVKPVTLIMGGLDVGADYKKLIPYVTKHVKLLILVGENRRKIFEALKNIVDTYLVESLGEAVHLSIVKGNKDDKVIFSPASAPEPHLYEGYEGRGEAFLGFIEKEFKNNIDLKRKADILKNGLKA